MSAARCSWTTSVRPFGSVSTTGAGGWDPAALGEGDLVAHPASRTASDIASTMSVRTELIGIRPPRGPIIGGAEHTMKLPGGTLRPRSYGAVLDRWPTVPGKRSRG